MKPIHLETFDLCIAALLVLFDAAISMRLGLRLHRQVLWAAARMVIQLLLVGLVLRAVFAWGSPVATLGVIVLMIGAAAREVAVRPARRLAGWPGYRIGTAVVRAPRTAPRLPCPACAVPAEP